MAYTIRQLIFLIWLCPVLFAAELPKNSVAWKIYQNECATDPAYLIHWNRGENFPSLGIGHFIWYPKNVHEKFTESFPKLITFLENKGIVVPAWLYEAAPWKDAHAMRRDSRYRSLQTFLIQTMPLQAEFMIQQLDTSLDNIVIHLSRPEREKLLHNYQSLRDTRQGKYILTDYRNFKGDGINPSERYHNKGWGLQQILLCMSPKEDPVLSFVQCARKVLLQRVQNAPPKRHEERWLKGWYNRIDTYLPK